MDSCVYTLSTYSVIVTLICLLYVFFDVNYFIRIGVTIAWGRLFHKKKNVEDLTEIYVTVIALLYALFDVNYIIRVIFTIIWGRLFETKKNVEDTTVIYGIVTTNDIDIFFKHMNNARYVRELDFARFHFYDRTGLYHEITKVKGHVLQTASYVRYRRTIPIFSTYKITTKIAYWDEKTLYIEQQFITLSDNFIRAVVLSKQSTIGLNVTEIMAKLLKKDPEYRPVPPPELEDWLTSIEKSSARLRKKD